MPISVLALTFLPLFLAPLLTHEMFTRLEARQRQRIALDNAAIALGRAEREIWQNLVREEVSLRRQEILHHSVHEKAFSSPHAFALDQSLETALRAKYQLASWRARVAWAAALGKAHAELERLGVPARIDRDPQFPFVEQRCLRCGLAVAWRPVGRLDVFVRGLEPPRLAAHLRLFRDGQPNYRLETGP